MSEPDPMTVAARTCPACGIPAPTLDAAAAVTDTHHSHLSDKLRAAAENIRKVVT